MSGQINTITFGLKNIPIEDGSQIRQILRKMGVYYNFQIMEEDENMIELLFDLDKDQ